MSFLLSDVQEIFEATFVELKSFFECNYISYLYQYHNYKLSFVTHSEWMDLYINQSFNKNCSLIRVGLEKISSSKTSSVILRWNDVQPITRAEKNIVGIRSEFNICNGISFGRKILGASDYFGLAADSRHFDFPKKIIFNSKRIKILMDNLFRASSAKLFDDYITHYKPINKKLLLEIISKNAT